MLKICKKEEKEKTIKGNHQNSKVQNISTGCIFHCGIQSGKKIWRPKHIYGVSCLQKTAVKN